MEEGGSPEGNRTDRDNRCLLPLQGQHFTACQATWVLRCVSQAPDGRRLSYICHTRQNVCPYLRNGQHVWMFWKEGDYCQLGQSRKAF